MSVGQESISLFASSWYMGCIIGHFHDDEYCGIMPECFCQGSGNLPLIKTSPNVFIALLEAQDMTMRYFLRAFRFLIGQALFFYFLNLFMSWYRLKCAMNLSVLGAQMKSDVHFYKHWFQWQHYSNNITKAIWFIKQHLKLRVVSGCFYKRKSVSLVIVYSFCSNRRTSFNPSINSVKSTRGRFGSSETLETLISEEPTEDKSQRIHLNVGGEIYETYVDTLARFPDTLLGDESRRKHYYCTKTRQYFYNRSRMFFDAILFFYQSGGILSCPEHVPLELFVEECIYYELPQHAIDLLQPVDASAQPADDVMICRRRTLRFKIWRLLRNPESSRAAWFVSMFSLFMIIASVISMCVETMPSLKAESNELNVKLWFIVELVLNVWFLLHLIVSTSCTPDIRKFLKSPMTWMDILAVLPYFVTIFIPRDTSRHSIVHSIFRIARIPRLLHVSRHIQDVRLVGKVVLKCVNDFKTIFLAAALMMVLGGSLIVYLEGEGEDGSGFTTIPQGMYWATVTMTTVGYGDLIPKSLAGRIFAGIYMFLAGAMITIPLVGVLHHFDREWYTKRDTREWETHVFYILFFPCELA